MVTTINEAGSLGTQHFKSFIKAPDEDQTVPTKRKPFKTNMKDRFSLEGKVNIITGGLGGIGSAIATGFAQMGGDVIIFDYATDGGKFSKSLEKEYGIRSKSYQVDVTKPEVVQAAVDAVIAEFQTIDTFIANAGITWYRGPILSEGATAEAWKTTIDVNLNSLFYCAKAVGGYFKQQNNGNFIITASMSASIANVPHYKAAYNASKAGALHMAKSLAVEWAGFARCNSVSPGYTDTSMSDSLTAEERAGFWALTPLGREADPDELVGAYVYLASDASSFTTGIDLKVDGGYTAI